MKTEVGFENTEQKIIMQWSGEKFMQLIWISSVKVHVVSSHAVAVILHNDL